MRWIWTLALASVLVASSSLLLPRVAQGCASCACGDPTLTTLGADQAFEARVRVGVVAEAQRERVATSRGDLALSERRVVAGATYAASRQHVLSLAVPLAWRSAELGGLHADAAGLGGVEVRWRAALWRDRSFAPRWLLMSHVGVEAPPWLAHDAVAFADDDWLPPAATTGFVGLSVLATANAWSGYLSVLGRTPIAGEGQGAHATIVNTTFVQWQPALRFAVRAGADARFEAERAEPASPSALWHAAHVGEGGGVATGLAVVVGPEVIWSPGEDIVVSAGARAPVVNTDEIVRAGPRLTLALTVDL